MSTEPKTKEIERTIIRIVEKDFVEELDLVQTDSRSQSISEKSFYERFATMRGSRIADDLRQFVDELVSEYNFMPKPGRGNRSLNLKSANDVCNFASVQESGEVWFYAIVSKTEELGDRQIGVDYLKSLAEIVEGQFDDSLTYWYWSVKRDGQYILIDEYLKHKSAWKELIENTLKRIWEIEE